ncbi:VOC family protein [Chitinophaga pendula]|uniref:glyoxalase superfamily protein n=1 Tax=Chitinophaga TaxID=79328 RepID=UPI000BB048D0|nr:MULTISPECIES: glyoxalase superfamily protein [Chitinophaga]ASZ12290.1 glyoxalase/bleomycin resistance/extradiol dioxygenase family protein [Chitinophaga sp. MD30]UCJ10121.1 VOC family protein [Chitinophaga pendula]
MEVSQVIPVLRMFDHTKMKEFYIDFLGFSVDWEHRFEENFPLYTQLSLGNIVLHLSQHHGDACPGARVFVECTGLKAYHASLLEKQYKYSRPGLEDAHWGAITMEVPDPFGNKIMFNERQTD